MDLGFLSSMDSTLWRAYDASASRAQSAARARRSGMTAAEQTTETAKTSESSASTEKTQGFDSYLKGYLDGMSGARSFGAGVWGGLGSYGSLGGLWGGYSSLANTLLGGASGSIFTSAVQSGRAGAKVNAAVNNPNMQRLMSFTNNRFTRGV